jgi:hypothetical protein
MGLDSLSLRTLDDVIQQTQEAADARVALAAKAHIAAMTSGGSDSGRLRLGLPHSVKAGANASGRGSASNRLRG